MAKFLIDPTLEGKSDAKIGSSYHFQAANELGSPDHYTEHVEHLLRYKHHISQYVPKGAQANYSNATMLDISRWLESASNILTVYGELDPWSSALLPVNVNNPNTYQYIVKESNHRASLWELPEAQKAQAIALVSGWLGKAPVMKESEFRKHKYLEDYELGVSLP
jgi:hypothetical protein